MNNRRRLILAAAASAFASTLPAAVRAAMGPNDKFDLLIRGGEVLDPSQKLRAMRDIGIRNGMIEAVEAEHSRRARAARDRRQGQARGPRPGGPPCPHLSLRLGHRHTRRRAGALPGDDHGGVRGRCRREQLRRLPALHRGLHAHPPLRLRAHRQHRPGGFPHRRALQHRLRTHRGCRPHARGERRHRDRHQGTHVGERDREERTGAAQARDQGVRDVGCRRREGDVPHRRASRTAS